MTSTTSTKNSFKQGLSVFLWTLKSSKATIIVYLSILCFTCICNFVIETGINGMTVTLGQGSEYLMYVPLTFQTVETAILAGIFAFVLSIQGFGYLHNKRKSDMFGALPVTRRTMYFSKMISAMVISLIPMLAVMIPLNIYGLNSGFMEICNFETTLKMTVFIIANVSFFGLLSVCCGKTSDTVISYIVIDGAYPVAMALLQLLPGSLVYGYAPDLNDYLTFALSPSTSLFSINIVYWLIFSAVCIAGSFFLVKRRKAESAQSHFAYKLPFVAEKLLVSFASGIAFAYLFLVIFGVDENHHKDVAGCYFNFWLGMVLGSIIAYIVIQIILAHGVKGLLKSLVSYGIMISAFAVVFIIMATGLFGYETSVPNAEDVAAVSVYNTRELYIKGKNVIESDCTDRFFIEDTIDIHKKIVENEVKKNYSMFEKSGFNLSGLFNRSFNNIISDDTNLGYLPITYTLKNGMKISRNYGSFEGDILKEVGKYKEKFSYKRSSNMLFICDDDYCSVMEVNDYGLAYDEEGYGCVLRSKKAKDKAIMRELMDAMREDIVNRDKNNIVVDDEDDESWFYLRMYYGEGKDIKNYIRTDMDIYKYDKNTIKVLKKYGDILKNKEDSGSIYDDMNVIAEYFNEAVPQN